MPFRVRSFGMPFGLPLRMRVPLGMSFGLPLGMRIILLGADMGTVAQISSFIQSTRDVVYLREADHLLIIRPNKIQHLNGTAYDILNALYHRELSAEETVSELSGKYSVPGATIRKDMTGLLESINAIMKEEYAQAPLISTVEFDPGSIKFPVLSEIAVTYRCQNRCDFCYASSPYRGIDVPEMTLGQIWTVIDKIRYEAQVPTISFTGGEPTLRDDLPEMIRHASMIGMRTNLITNGIRCSDPSFVSRLAEAGLNSAQVSLESHRADIHDGITSNSGSHEKTVRGIENLKAAGVYTHTNTTICQKNKYSLKDLVTFLHEKYNVPYLSMNMIIATGIARDNDNVRIGYSAIGEVIDPLIDYCEVLGVKFVWYSPTPYCMFNPVDRNLGSKSCACISGLLSVNPSGEVLPCSSYDRGVGSLLKHSFMHIWNSDQALYWRERRYTPPVCRACEYKVMCGGACPLYWEHAGSFDEIERVRNMKPIFRNLLWNLENRLRIRTKGIQGRTTNRG
jgi:radical SAM protein with 4Fe4S-binding SPASM domain